MKIMASVPITSWQIDGETVETVRDFIIVVENELQLLDSIKVNFFLEVFVKLNGTSISDTSLISF